MNTPKKFFILAAVALVATTGCKNDDDDDNPSPNNNRTVAIDIDAQWGPAAFSLGSNYMDNSGNTVRFDRIEMYLSNLKAMDAAGNEVGNFPDAILVDASATANEFTLGTVSAADVTDLVGYIGLDSATNHADPMLASAPLNDATMHWTWNPMAGYKFVVIEGMVDTDGDGTVDANFEYHLATDNLYTQFALNPNGTVNAGETLSLQVKLDVQAAVSGVDIANNLDTHTMNEPALAAQLMGNMATAMEID